MSDNKDTAAVTDEEDLSKLDDGSEFEGTDDGDEKADDKKDEKDDDARERGEDGRFKKGDEKKEEKKPAAKKTDVKKDDGKKDGADEEEGDDADAEEGDDADAGEEEGEEKGDKTAARIRTVIEQRNKAREQVDVLTERVAALEKQNAKAEQKEEDTTKALKDELAGLYESVEELRADNKTKDAAKAQRRIDEIKEELADVKAAATARRESFATAENREYDRMLDFLEEVRPVVKKGSEDFDPDVVKELDFQVKAYERMGMPATKALRRAAALLFTEDPFAPAKTVVKGDKDEKKEPGAKKTDVKKNVEAAKKTPPKSERSEVSEKDRKLDVSKMSIEEFNALPESKKKELGGDFLE